MNHYSSIDCATHQQKALESRGLFLSPEALLKLKVLGANTSKAALDLPNIKYIKLTQSVTDIIHNTQPISITRSINTFKPQFKAMLHLFHLTHEYVSLRPQNTRFKFQFISSITTIDYYPLWSGQAQVLEETMSIKSVLPNSTVMASLYVREYLTRFRNNT
jgi:thioester reductase-like protein